jgi:hypothetical protein
MRCEELDYSEQGTMHAYIRIYRMVLSLRDPAGEGEVVIILCEVLVVLE